jgi:phosphoesterase RecJ-like protein
MRNQQQPMNSVPPELCDALRTAKRTALIGHVTPDADCLTVLGSMKLALEQLGKQPVVALPEGTVARRLQFLLDLADVRPGSGEQLAACDAALVMDTAKDRRVNVDGKLEALPNAKILNVDHHASNTRFGAINWVDGGRSSTAEMVYEVICALGCRITPQIATLIYAGIHNDTQGFSLANTTTRSLEIAHDVAAAGAQVVETCERLNRSRSRSEFDLLKVVYQNTRVSDDGRLGWSTADHEEIREAGCTANDIDDQVEAVRSIEGVQVAILFSEGNQGKVRMNFRGERGVSVLELAQQFRGGGHAQAAGAILDGTIPTVVERVIPAALDFVTRLPQA